MSSLRPLQPTCARRRTTTTSPLVASSLVLSLDCVVSLKSAIESLIMCWELTIVFPTVRTFPALLGYGIALSTAMTAFEYTGGTLFGYKKDTSVGEFDRRTALRKAFQTPGEQTVAELGEGRGMYFCLTCHYINTNFTRCLRPRLRGETPGAHQGRLWY